MGRICRASAWAAWLGIAAGGCTTTGEVLAAIDGTGSASASGTGTGTSSGTGTVVGCGDETWWCGEPGLTWQVQRIGPVDDSVNADVYVVPMFTTDLTAIARLHSQGRDVICWFSAGISAWGDPDRDAVYPATGPDIVPGQSERWMDVGSPIIRDAIAARLDQAAALGCDAVEPSDLHGYLGESGVDLTRAGTLEYVQWMSGAAHDRGLAIALSDATELAAQLEPSVELAIDYGCLAAGTCADLAPFTAAGKLVLHAEIIDGGLIGEVEQHAAEVCPASAALSLVTIFKKIDLNAWSFPCDAP